MFQNEFLKNCIFNFEHKILEFHFIIFFEKKILSGRGAAVGSGREVYGRGRVRGIEDLGLWVE